MKPRRRVVAASVLAAMFVSAAAPAYASHFRASTSAVTYSAGVITWKIDDAWAHGRDDKFLRNSASVHITDANGGAVPGAVVGTPSNSPDVTNPLFDLSRESVTIDISALLSTPGRYTAYASSCCRISGVQNTSGNNSFSQSMSFTVTANGTVDLPPDFKQQNLYTLIPVGSNAGLRLDYTTNDPEQEVVSYALMNTPTGPDYGAAALPCSDFTSGVLRLDASLCAAGTTFTDVYKPGYFFAVKVKATDSVGNIAETDTLLRVPTAPLPYIGTLSNDHGTATVTVKLRDADTYVDHYDVTCTNTGDPSDVKTATSPASPVLVTGLTSGATYTCSVSATNGLGTNTDATTQNVSVGRYTTGPGGAPQQTTIPVPTGGAITLIDGAGQPATTVTIPSQGVYTLDPATGVLIFAPVAGFSGNTTPVIYRVTDAGGATSDATYSTIVVAPAPPPVTTLATHGTGTTTQSLTWPIPAGGSVHLVDAAGNPVSMTTLPGQGVYTFDPTTSTLSFLPAPGYSGTPTPAAVTVTDVYGQATTSHYAPIVAKPAPPAAGPIISTGAAGAAQQKQIALPPGDTITMLDAAAHPVSALNVAREGTYTLDAATGVITFVPVKGFAGQGKGVRYQLSDGYGQTSIGTLRPTVRPTAVTVGTPKVVAPRLSVNPSTIPATCSLSAGAVDACAVMARARINGVWVQVGSGAVDVTSVKGAAHVTVLVKLNPVGRALAARPDGATFSLIATVRQVDVPGSRIASATAHAVAPAVSLHPVYFDIGSATLRPLDRTYLDTVRKRLGRAVSLTCTGFTDSSASDAFNVTLGQQRAAAICAELTKGNQVHIVTVSKGEARPTYPNTTNHGRQLNRRGEAVLHY
jgi:CshA-type fibril repeat protein